MSKLKVNKAYWVFGILALLLNFSACQQGLEVSDSFVITLETDPSINYLNNFFENGEKIRLSGIGSVPNGLTGFSLERKVGNGAYTPIPLAEINVLNGNLPNPNGVTAFSFLAEIDIVGSPGQTVTIRLAAGSESENKIATLGYQVVAQGQGGAGGTQPLLYPAYTVEFGGQEASFKAYLATHSGSSQSTYTATQVNALSDDDKRKIDISFGIADAQGNAGEGAAATVPALISPHNRTARNFNDAGLGNLASITSFKQETSIVSLTEFEQITSSKVTLDILHNTGSAAFQPLEAGKCYSFINQNGRKGYLWVNQISIVGTQEEQQVSLTILVQRS